jgi:hypothetical protein
MLDLFRSTVMAVPHQTGHWWEWLIGGVKAGPLETAFGPQMRDDMPLSIPLCYSFVQNPHLDRVVWPTLKTNHPSFINYIPVIVKTHTWWFIPL